MWLGCAAERGIPPPLPHANMGVAQEDAMLLVMVKIEGRAALIMHNGRLANPLDEYAQAIKKITTKTKKTEDDYLEIARLEFLGGMYFDPKIGPYFPGETMDATIKNGAKLLRRGAAILRAVTVQEEQVKLEYNGPRDPAKMFVGELKSPFVDMRGVSSSGGKGGSRVMRCRPIFHPPWSATFTLQLDEQMMNPEDLRQCVEYAGRYNGHLDGRPRYGKFEIADWVVG